MKNGDRSSDHSSSHSGFVHMGPVLFMDFHCRTRRPMPICGADGNFDRGFKMERA